MPRINPAIFEAWQDPEGGEWIRLKTGAFEGVTWRPANMEMDGDRVKFAAEFFEGPGVTAPPDIDSHEYKKLESVCGKCIHDILAGYAADASEN